MLLPPIADEDADVIAVDKSPPVIVSHSAGSFIEVEVTTQWTHTCAYVNRFVCISMY